MGISGCVLAPTPGTSCVMRVWRQRNLIRGGQLAPVRAQLGQVDLGSAQEACWTGVVSAVNLPKNPREIRASSPPHHLDLIHKSLPATVSGSSVTALRHGNGRVGRKQRSTVLLPAA